MKNKKNLPTKEEFDRFVIKLKALGFSEIRKSDFKKDFMRLGLIAPRKRYGREIGFYFSHPNGLSIIVWTTFLVDENVAREEDSGWVLIKEGDEVPYFATPIRRTKRFFLRILRNAWLAKYRVIHRPLCPICNAYMKIQKGRALGSRYWICKSENHPGKIGREDWDKNLPPKALSYIKQNRKARASYRKKRLEEGKTVGQARIKRKKWKVHKPANKI